MSYVLEGAAFYSYEHNARAAHLLVGYIAMNSCSAAGTTVHIDRRLCFSRYTSQYFIHYHAVILNFDPSCDYDVIVERVCY